MLNPDQLRAIRKRAEAEIERIDGEIKERPHSPALAQLRADWAKAAYLADAELQRQEADHDRA